MIQRVILGQEQRKVIYTFRTTADAMQMEKICRDNGAPGRLIPVPGSIQAGCGMCWAAPPEARPQLEALASEAGLVPERVVEGCV